MSVGQFARLQGSGDNPYQDIWKGNGQTCYQACRILLWNWWRMHPWYHGHNAKLDADSRMYHEHMLTAR